MKKIALCWLTLASPMMVACGGGDSNDSGTIADVGDIRSQWAATDDAQLEPLVEALADSGLVEGIAEALNQWFALPGDLTITHQDCGTENAFYMPGEGSITMCYEMLRRVAKTIYDDSLTEEELATRLVGSWTFILFHELGHALIDYYDLPSTGREEDAVDDLASVVMVEADLGDQALEAARFWALLDEGMYGNLDYADEHSLNRQRFFTILCNVYGSDPESYDWLIGSEEDGMLPETRAARCPREYQQKAAAWDALLAPYTK